jgi:hypothetical protein
MDDVIHAVLDLYFRTVWEEHGDRAYLSQSEANRKEAWRLLTLVSKPMQVRVNAPDKTITFPNGSTIRVIDSSDETKLRGLHFQSVFIDDPDVKYRSERSGSA